MATVVVNQGALNRLALIHDYGCHSLNSLSLHYDKTGRELTRPRRILCDCLVFLKLYSVKSGNTCLSVANSEGKTNGYCAKPSPFRQAATPTLQF